MKFSTKLFLVILIAVAFSFILNRKTNSKTESPIVNLGAQSLQESKGPLPPAVAKLAAPTVVKSINSSPASQVNTVPPTSQQAPLNSNEIESVDHLIKAISKSLAKNSGSKKFMKEIQGLHLHPMFVDEGSDSLGSTVVVRTHDALAGTRYLHAQFAGEKNKTDFLQHVSFQIRPGQNSFQKVVEILEQVLPKNKTLKERSSDYVLYNTDDGYVAWAKIADREDLKSNKYNASSKEDIGTVIVTIEQEIHGMDHDHDHDHDHDLSH